MKNGSKWLIGILVLFPHLMWGQSTSETALLFSRIKPGGSARIQGMGGVQTSLGGDYSSAFSLSDKLFETKIKHDSNKQPGTNRY